MDRVRVIVTSVAAGLLVAAAGASAAEAEWPGWRGPKRDGKSPDTGLLKQWPANGPKRLWEVDDIGSGFSSVAVTGGTIYITGTGGGALTLHAFDMAGKRKWDTRIDRAYTDSHPGARSTPMIDGESLYLVSGNGLVGCYSAKTGRKKWSRQMSDFDGRRPGWGFAESVLIYKGLAIVTPGGRRGCVVALDKRTGRTKWASRGNGGRAQYGSCIAIPHKTGCVIALGNHGGLLGVDAKDGRLLFNNTFSVGNTANCPTPAYSKRYLFWANGYGKGGICLKLSRTSKGITAREAWRTRDMVCHHGGYVIHEGHIYGNHDRGWACLELETGRTKWNERGVGKGSLCWADGMLYLFGEGSGRVGLATCSPDGMEMRGEFRVRGSGPSWAHPVVIGGRLYVRYDTNLYCFDVKAE